MFMNMCMWHIYVTNLITIILLPWELHYLGMFSFTLQKENKKRKETLLGYYETLAMVPNIGGRG